MHISGHEEKQGDKGWGWLDKTWEEEVKNVWQWESLPGNVRVPALGETLNL